ncbi:methyl-accepting chemotaxis protein [Halomonas faecis]|uniref:methyl-accepting chemotaxis protein n=1 Tax=Halomonas faecis TaxID=1562110 RepID=UPI0013D6E928|nr:methyl-accepting chemotaxis protein [Halomonas faecis]
MYFFRDISIGYKILLALMLPLLAMGGFAGLQLMERQSVVSDMGQLHGLTRLALTAGDLVHELQRERGGTAIFIGTQGDRFVTELREQRERTDRRVTLFQERLKALGGPTGDAQTRQLIEGVQDGLSGMAALRHQVDELSATAGQASDQYTELNTELISIVGQLSHDTDEAQTTRSLAAYYSLLRAKELAGIERARLSLAFGRDRIGADEYQHFVSLIGAQEAQLDTFRILATAEQRVLLRETLAEAPVERLEGLRKAVLHSESRQAFGVDPEVWFEQQSVKIDRLKDVEDDLAESVLTSVQGLRDAAKQELVGNGVIAGGVAGLALLVAVLIGRSTVLRLRQTAQAMREIAEGDGDLTRRLSVTHQDEIGTLAIQFNAFAARMQELLLEVKGSAQRVHAAAEEIAHGSESLAARTEQEASSLQETSASMEQITATVNQSAESAQQANELALSAAVVARKGEAAMEEVGGTMTDINASAARIAEIITLIDNIAFQTNILALNASVEAARASEHGRGFAVVAQEVRVLASRSTDAAREIRQLIEASVEHTQDGAQIVQHAGRTMQDMVHSVERVNSVIAEISAGAREQSVGISQVNQAVSELDGNTQRNVALVEQASSAAAEMREESEHLNALMGGFVLDRRDPAKSEPVTHPETLAAVLAEPA